MSFETSIGLIRETVPNLHHIVRGTLGSRRFETFGQSSLQLKKPERRELVDEPVYETLLSLHPEYKGLLDGWWRSYYTSEAHLKSVLMYDRPLIGEPHQNAEWNETKIMVKRLFEQFDKVTSLDFTSQLSDVPFEASSAAGFGYQGKKGDVENIKKAKSTANGSIHELDRILSTNPTAVAITDWTRRQAPDISYTRTQLTYVAEKLKVRSVFGEPFHTILIEGLSAAPLMDWFATHTTFFTIGFNPLERVPEIIKAHAALHGITYCIDWSMFDATVHEWEINFAFDLLKSMLTFPNRISEICFEATRLLFIHRKIIAPNGNIYMKHAGIPSGSYFTILIGSIVNFIRINYLFKKTTGEFPRRVDCQGDDSVTTISATFNVGAGALAHESAVMHWIIHPEKQEITTIMEDIVYLNRSISAGYNVRDRNRAIRLACFPEHPVTDPRISTTRVKMLCDDTSWRVHALADTYRVLSRKYPELPYSEVPREFKKYALLLSEHESRRFNL